MNSCRVIIEGLDGDRGTELELDARIIEIEKSAEPFLQPGTASYQIRVRDAHVRSVSGGFGPDSILGQVARSGRAQLSAAQAKLERPKAFAVRMRLTKNNGPGEMRTYTAASGQRYVGEYGFPDKIHIVLNPVEAEELRAFDQFEIVQVSEDPGDVDGQLATMQDALDRLFEHAEAIREDPGKAMEVFEAARTKAELFARMLRAEADHVEKQVTQAQGALVGEATKGGKS